ncbi:non-homologous end-joining DNA ligase [Rhizobium sp. WSM1274]|uniref:non-homologous end-joining DNA ligase n=1 Tax=Rhizobium sp. WSM1274 TaxID=3138254 RepID=UPI0021A79269|nr:non-homologous end-joining DNA ligase [Rhizobium leguminosarum]UWU30784.1 non-homologous end-joining DNA ligase [Rhizobium leguminosarum bv. viciae]
MVKRPSKPSSKPLLREAETPLKGSRRRRRNPEQPALPFDPMPDRIEPCLALLKPTAPSGPDWVYEIKWDGYRVAVHLDYGKVRIITRGGHDWTHRFPTIQAAAKALPVGTAIIDGEAVVLDAMGRSDFGALQQALGGRIGKRSADEALFMAFDLLYFDGHDLRGLEQESRRQLLEDLIPTEADGGVRLSQEIEGDGPAILAAACEHRLEGIIAKRRGEPYRSGRGGEWIKIKCIQSEGFAIIGYERSTAGFGGIGRLLLAAMKSGNLTYVGGVGTGFNERSATELRKQLDEIVVDKPVVDTGRKKRDAAYVRPVLIAEVEFRAWTADRKLRHASFKGLRDSDDAEAIFEIGDFS